jgi:hypothetical protein
VFFDASWPGVVVFVAVLFFAVGIGVAFGIGVCRGVLAERRRARGES